MYICKYMCMTDDNREWNRKCTRKYEYTRTYDGFLFAEEVQRYPDVLEGPLEVLRGFGTSDCPLLPPQS